MGPRVTVVVATHDRLERLRESLPRHEAPVLVVDNASTDGTADALGARVIALDRNRGGAGRNVGVTRRAHTLRRVLR